MKIETEEEYDALELCVRALTAHSEPTESSRKAVSIIKEELRFVQPFILIKGDIDRSLANLKKCLSSGDASKLEQSIKSAISDCADSIYERRGDI